MTISDLFALGNLLDKYTSTLDKSSAEYVRAIIVNSDITSCLAAQTKEGSKCKRNNTSRL